MGDPKKQRKKYSAPLYPWRKDRIDRDKALLKEYGLKNRKEIWKLESKLRRYAQQAKRLIGSSEEEQFKKETLQLLTKLARVGVLNKTAKLDDVLALEIRNLLDRRLQTLVFKKGLSNSTKQARQFIVHGHIFVGDKKVSAPSYIVQLNEENTIKFCPSSNILILKEKGEGEVKNDTKK